MKTLAIFGLFFTSLFASFAQYNNATPGARGEFWSGSPRLLIESGDASTVELSSTNVTANVIGVIADVTVRQTYVNRGAQPIEAVYVFPGSTRAAVYGMTMTVGKRIVRAVIREKEQARRQYDSARAEGKAASLLEMLRPNVFRMNVANVLPGDSIITEMRYTEAIPLAEGTYEFMYPAVVAPRYAGGSQGAVDAALSDMNLPSEIPGKFSISTNISTGVPLREVVSPSHKLSMETIDAKSERRVTGFAPNSITRVGISTEDTGKKNRDFVLRYALTGRAVESGLLLHKGKDENFFMLMVQPPQTVEIPNIVPREFIFIVDVSGSMSGQPLTIAQRLMDSLFTSLRPQDKFNIMMFSGGQSVLGEQSLPATKENIAKAATFLRSGYGGGGTELLPALRRALAMPSDSGYSRSFVAVTDGVITIERDIFKLVRQNLNNANIYAFGIGNYVNRFFIEGLARAGNADPMIVTNWNEAPAMADKFKRYIEAPVLTDIKVDFGKLNVYDVEPQSIADVTSQRPIVVFGKWRGKPEGAVKLTGSGANGAYSVNVDVEAAPIRPENSALRYLWARNRIDMIEDESNNSPLANEQKIITDIGLKYNLLTKFTSFVAIDSIISVPGKFSTSHADTTTEDIRGDKKYPEPEIAEGAVKKGRIFNGVVSGSKLPVGKKTSKAVEETVSKTEIGKISGKREQVQEVAKLSAGIASDGSGFVIRGGRTQQTQVRVDGLDVGDQVTGGIGTSQETSKALSPQKQTTSTGRAGYFNTTGNSQSGTQAPATTQPATVVNGNLNGTYPAQASGGQQVTVTAQRTQPEKQKSGGATRTATESTTSARSAPTQVVSVASSDYEESDPLSPAEAPMRFSGSLIAMYNRSSLTNFTGEGLTARPLSTASESMSGLGLGLGGEYVLGNPRNSKSALIFQLMYDRVYFKNSATDSVLSAQFTNVLGRYDFNATAMRLTLNLAYKYNFWRRLNVFAGIGFNYIVTADHSYSVTSDVPLCPCQSAPEDIQNGGKTIEFSKGSNIPGLNRFGAGLLAGLGYDISLTNRLTLAPSVQVEYQRTSFVTGGGKPLTFRAGLSLLQRF